MGIWHLRRGDFAKAEDYFRMAISTLTERNPNPIDGEPYFNLGLSLRFQEEDKEAYAETFIISLSFLSIMLMQDYLRKQLNY
jgi:hypothetical protein